jgi:hypothetical protein
LVTGWWKLSSPASKRFQLACFLRRRFDDKTTVLVAPKKGFHHGSVPILCYNIHTDDAWMEFSIVRRPAGEEDSA